MDESELLSNEELALFVEQEAERRNRVDKAIKRLEASYKFRLVSAPTPSNCSAPPMAPAKTPDPSDMLAGFSSGLDFGDMNDAVAKKGSAIQDEVRRKLRRAPVLGSGR